MSDIEDRLTQIEQQLARIEVRLGFDLLRSSTQQKKRLWSDASPPNKTDLRPKSGQPWGDGFSPLESMSATTILGWGGALALVLAASYLIQLAITGGWLTPARQILGAVLSGALLVGIGIKLKESDRVYASLLPAGGIVIFFLSIYGAHLYYHMISPMHAGITVIGVCIFPLALCALFKTQLYAFFAAIGSYSAPFLLSGSTGDITDTTHILCFGIFDTE